MKIPVNYPRSCICDGIKFETMRAAARHFNVSSQTIRYRCDSKYFTNWYFLEESERIKSSDMAKERVRNIAKERKALRDIKARAKNKKDKAVVYEKSGRAFYFRNAQSLANYLNVSRERVRQYINDVNKPHIYRTPGFVHNTTIHTKQRVYMFGKDVGSLFEVSGRVGHSEHYLRKKILSGEYEGWELLRPGEISKYKETEVPVIESDTWLKRLIRSFSNLTSRLFNAIISARKEKY